MAIEHGITIISWFENLSKDEVPPEYLWEDSDGLELWWGSVEDKRNDGAPKRGRYDPEHEDGDQPEEMAENELARALKR